MRQTKHRLLFQCPDQHGIIAAVSSTLSEAGCNVVSLDEHVSGEEFFLRAEFTAKDDIALTDSVSPLAERFGARYRFAPCKSKKAVLLFSREHHCLVDLLWRAREGALPIDIVGLLSNHEDRADEWAQWAPFSCVPTLPEQRENAEQKILQKLNDWQPEIIILARYMRILSADFLMEAEKMGAQIINIHHSFLPAFPGADPYGQAWEKGVKMIGATAHFVVAELDAGPIISQDVSPVSHRDTPETMKLKGQDLERVVLARAALALAEDRVLQSGQRTIVF